MVQYNIRECPTEEKDDFYLLLDNNLHNIRNSIQMICKIGKEDYLKPIIGNHSLHQVSNENSCRVIKLTTDKNFKIKSTMFPHKNIHKGT